MAQVAKRSLGAALEKQRQEFAQEAQALLDSDSVPARPVWLGQRPHLLSSLCERPGSTPGSLSVPFCPGGLVLKLARVRRPAGLRWPSSLPVAGQEQRPHHLWGTEDPDLLA